MRLGSACVSAGRGRRNILPDLQLVAKLRDKGGLIELFQNPKIALKDVDAVYTNTWVSMGQESETEDRVSDFAPYQINPSLFSKAKDDAVFMHCLPAHRGHEVTDVVMMETDPWCLNRPKIVSMRKKRCY